MFAYGLLLVRIAGRRVFANWTALDIIVSIVTGSSLSRALTGSAALGGTLLATTLLMALHWLLAHLSARFALVSTVLEGKPIPLAQRGRTEHGALVRHSISETALHEALRQSSVDDVADTKLVMLEPSGKITVLKASPPPTPHPSP